MSRASQSFCSKLERGRRQIADGVVVSDLAWRVPSTRQSPKAVTGKVAMSAVVVVIPTIASVAIEKVITLAPMRKPRRLIVKVVTSARMRNDPPRLVA